MKISKGWLGTLRWEGFKLSFGDGQLLLRNHRRVQLSGRRPPSPVFINTLVFFRMLGFNFGLENSHGRGAGTALGCGQKALVYPTLPSGAASPFCLQQQQPQQFGQYEDWMWLGDIRHMRNHWINRASLLVMLLESQAVRQPSCTSQSQQS